MTQPRILFYDIETLPNRGYFWDLWNGTNHKMVAKQKSIITIAYKFSDEKKVHLISALDFLKAYKKDPYDDRQILEAFLPILEQADYVVAHNGDKFDNKIIAGRLFFNNLPPLPILNSIDTLKLVRRHLNINSRRLEYIAQQLGFGQKGDIGIDDWIGAAEGCETSVKRMGEYNKKDVLLLEKIYYKLLPHTGLANKINHKHFNEDAVCPTCGGKDVHKRGYYYTKATKKQRYSCKSCNVWFAKLIPKSELQAQVAELMEK